MSSVFYFLNIKWFYVYIYCDINTREVVGRALNPQAFGYLCNKRHVVCCVSRVEIQIEIRKGRCTADTDSKV